MLPEFTPGDRVTDIRYGNSATVRAVAYDGPVGVDGYGIIVEYDDEPGVPVSTGTDYFRLDT